MPKRSSWTDSDIAECLRLRDEERHTWEVIGDLLGRSKTACQAKWDYVHRGMHRRKYTKIEKVISKSIAPCEQQLDRDARVKAGARDLTGWFFGDPPRGYSALDRREAHEHRHGISPNYPRPSTYQAPISFASEVAEQGN